MSQRNIDRTNWLGVCLVAIGIIYLNKYNSWDLFHLHHYIPHHFYSWQAIVVTAGVLLLLFGRSVGLLLIFLGVVFWIPEKLFVAIGHLHQWWPLIFILIGVSMLVRSGHAQKS